jgi:hypothetical protein
MKVSRVFSSWIHKPEVILSEQFNFGHREILLSCNGINPNIFINGLLQHGWYPDPENIDFVRRKNLTFYPLYSWGDPFLGLGLNPDRIIPIGAPWLHLLKATGISSLTVKNLGISSKRALYLPTHSLPGYSLKNYGIGLDEYISSFGEFTVCLYWTDYIDPAVQNHYRSLFPGADIRCAGFKGSPGVESPWAPVGGRVMFLPNLLDFFLDAELIIFDQISTAFWYALSLGKKVLVLNLNRELTEHSLINQPGKVFQPSKDYGNYLLNLGIAAGQIHEPTVDQVNFALGILGADYLENFEIQMSLNDNFTEAPGLEGLCSELSGYILKAQTTHQNDA